MPRPQHPAIDLAELAILAAHYPEVHRLVGARDFDDCVRGFLATPRAQGVDMDALSRAFPDFIAEHSRWRARTFLADLARVERAQLEVARAMPAPSLSAAELAALSPDQWASARLVTVPGLRLLALSYPIHRYLALARDGNDAPLPSARASWVAVWRSGSITTRGELSQIQHAILEGLAAGCTLAEALTSAATYSDDADSLMTALASWFRQWTAGGMFEKLVTDSESVAESGN